MGNIRSATVDVDATRGTLCGQPITRAWVYWNDRVTLISYPLDLGKYPRPGGAAVIADAAILADTNKGTPTVTRAGYMEVRDASAHANATGQPPQAA